VVRNILYLIVLIILINSAFALNFDSNGELVPDSSVLLLMHLNNDAQDSSGNNHDGTPIGGASLISGGKFGGAYSFDNINGVIDFGDPGFLEGLSEISVILLYN